MLNRRTFLTLCSVIATGLLLKQAPSQPIHDPLEAEPLLHPTIARKLIRELNRPTFLPPEYARLTDREAEVLILAARGLSKQEIAERLLISKYVVGSHHKSLMHKTRYAL